MPLALWLRFAVVWAVVHCVRSQGTVQFSYSSNPVYSGEPVTLTCTYGFGLLLLQVAIGAFNDTIQKGLLFCDVPRSNTTGVGVFDGNNFNRCPATPVGTASVSTTLTAVPFLALDYNCTAKVIDAFSVYTMTSTLSSLQVWVLPQQPAFTQSPIVFKESDIALIVCESRYGRPAAAITLTVVSPSGKMELRTGSESASLILPKPVTEWHGATATCTVTNHNFSSMVVTRNITISYIRGLRVPAVFNTSTDNVTLDCAAYVSSYPGVRYSWSVQLDSDITDSSVVNGSSNLLLMQGQSGQCICIATNSVTMKAVVVVFTARSRLPICTPTIPNECSGSEQCWIVIPTVGGVVVAIAAILGVLHKRGQCSKMSLSRLIRQKQQSDTFATTQSAVVITSLPSDDHHYDHLNIQLNNELTYEELTKEKNDSFVAIYEDFQHSKQPS